MKYSILCTNDKSFTISNIDFGETYHSVHGAIQESRQIYIDLALMPFLNKNLPEINVFEMGFGTGLNCFLTYVLSKNVVINYNTIEKFILPSDILKQLNYSSLISENDKHIFEEIHKCSWNLEKKISENFRLFKIQNDILDYNFPENHYDIVYYDAFSPETQPELWTESIFSNLYNALKINGILVTYSAKGSVRRAMQSVGFTVERLPGPLGKREMLRGRKIDFRF